MDSTIMTLFEYVIKITVLGGMALFCFKFMEGRKKSGQKNQILNLNAKLSMLRMTLRAKIKSKSHKYRALFKTQVTAGDPMDIALNELIGLGLENGDDLQRYFDVSKKVNSLLIAEGHTESETKRDSKNDLAVGKEDFMGTDFKSEIAILRLIKEMVDVSQQLNKKIEVYNSANPKTPIAKVNALNFPSLAEVNRVFVSEKTNVTSNAA